ncbi:hypothetical protein AKJ16_DCAP01641 [Drosera capensis]
MASSPISSEVIFRTLGTFVPNLAFNSSRFYGRKRKERVEEDTARGREIYEYLEMRQKLNERVKNCSETFFSHPGAVQELYEKGIKGTLRREEEYRENQRTGRA